jgi:hypothetical protein
VLMADFQRGLVRVRFGSLADVSVYPIHVPFTLNDDREPLSRAGWAPYPVFFSEIPALDSGPRRLKIARL